MLHSHNTDSAQPGSEPSSRPALRILLICTSYYPAVRYGGPIRSVHELARSLVRRGHTVHVLTSSLDGPHDLDVPLGTPVDIDGVQVRYFRAHHPRRLCRCPDMKQVLREQIGDYDVLHMQGVFLWPIWMAARMAEAAGVPYLIAPRGMLGRAVVHGKNRLFKTLWINAFDRRTLREAAGVHFTSDIEQSEVESFGLPVPRAFCVPNGVTVPADYPRLAEGPHRTIRQPYVLFLSRLNWKKGLDRLITAWQWVPDITLMIAGNDETGYQTQLERLAVEVGVRPRIEFLGAVSDAHKWALYEQAMLFVLPSYSENFGNVVAEAMAVGCPVVVTPEVGISELVRGSGSGVVVDGNPASLSTAINSLVRDEPARRLMGQKGRFTARRHLTWDSIAVQMESAYRQAAPASNSRSVHT